MGILITIISIIACLLLILVIMVQNPKGGGLASGFSSANQIGGIKRTTDFLEKSTWTLLITILVLSVFSSSISKVSTVPGEEVQQDGIEELIGNEATTPVAPALPTETPATPQPESTPENGEK